MQGDPFQFLTETDRALLFKGARRASYQRGATVFREGEAQPNLYVLHKGHVRVEKSGSPDPFRFLTQNDRQLLFAKVRRASHERGQVLFEEGEPQPDIYILRTGRVRVTRLHQGQSIAVARYGPEEVLGELAFLEQRPAFGTATAEEHVVVDILEGRQALAMLASDSGLAARFYHSLALCLGMRLRQILPGLDLAEGQNIAVARYGPGEVLGEVSFLAQQSALGTVIAEEDVELTVLDAKQLQDILQSDSGLASRFYHSLALCLSTRVRQIMPGLELPQGLLTASSRPTRSGQLTARQYPPDLVRSVEQFRTAMEAIDGHLRSKHLSALSAQQVVNEHCNALVTALNQFTRDDALLEIGMADLLSFRDLPDVARGIGGFVFRETFPLFMQSATIAIGYEKPRGITEEFEFLERIEKNEPEGDEHLGPVIDAWFLNRPLCRARRSDLRQATAFLREATAGAAPADPVRLTSLRVGTANEIFDLPTTPTANVLVTCIDSDHDTLRINAGRAAQYHFADRITFLQTDLRTIGCHGNLSLGPQHAIYALGLCDIMNDDAVRVLLEWAYGWLVPGGALLLTNRNAASPDRAFVEHILDWPVIHRTREEFMRLLEASPFRTASGDMETPEDGGNLVAKCRKH